MVIVLEMCNLAGEEGLSLLRQSDFYVSRPELGRLTALPAALQDIDH